MSKQYWSHDSNTQWYGSNDSNNGDNSSYQNLFEVTLSIHFYVNEYLDHVINIYSSGKRDTSQSFPLVLYHRLILKLTCSFLTGRENCKHDWQVSSLIAMANGLGAATNVFNPPPPPPPPPPPHVELRPSGHYTVALWAGMFGFIPGAEVVP